MYAEALTEQLLDTSRGRIVTLLRAGGMTADDIARQLGVTPSAVRIQLRAMERDGVLTKTGQRRGTTRPWHVFELTSEVEQLLSKAYMPLLTGLVEVFAEALPADQVDVLLRRTGRGLAQQLTGGKRVPGGLRARVDAASDMLNQHLGALTRVERNGGIAIRGAGCPLAALTGKHKGVCLAVESLVTEIVRVPVQECCERRDRPRCCFHIHPAASR